MSIRNHLLATPFVTACLLSSFALYAYLSSTRSGGVWNYPTRPTKPITFGPILERFKTHKINVSRQDYRASPSRQLQHLVFPFSHPMFFFRPGHTSGSAECSGAQYLLPPVLPPETPTLCRLHLHVLVAVPPIQAFGSRSASYQTHPHLGFLLSHLFSLFTSPLGR